MEDLPQNDQEDHCLQNTWLTSMVNRIPGDLLLSVEDLTQKDQEVLWEIGRASMKLELEIYYGL